MPSTPAPMPDRSASATAALSFGSEAKSTVHTTIASESNDSNTSTVPVYEVTGKGELTLW